MEPKAMGRFQNPSCWISRAILCMLLAVVVCMGIFPVHAASENTTYTYTLSADDEWIRTQDAYLPGKIYFSGRELNQPQDLFLRNGLIYIADTGNHRVVLYDLETDTMTSIGDEELQSPVGLFVQEDGTVYVADSSKENPGIVVFSSNGRVKMRIGRPDSYLFSQRTAFTPRNVVVTKEGNIFVASTGTYEGLLQFSDTGVFQGFFGANLRSGSLMESLQDLFFTDEQLDKLLTRTPRQIENITISNRDLIYSVTQTGGRQLAWGSSVREGNAIALHNMTGSNILAKGKTMADEWNFVDIVAGPYNNCYALTYTGLIYEYDSAGNLIFSFGGRAVSTDRTGLFTVAAAIDIDDNGFLYVLDKERALIQVFCPTDFAVATHKAIYDLEVGDYAAAEADWLAILRRNGMSKLAHQGYGQALFQQQRFEEAAKHFRLAGDHERYSNAFWEIRAAWLNRWVLVILIVGIVLYALFAIYRFLRRHYGFLEKDADSEDPKAKLRPGLWSDLRYVRTMLRHPIDGYYYLKHGEHGSVLSATILYVAIIAIFTADALFRGFVFNYSNVHNTSFFSVLVTITMPIGLFVIGNALVSAICAGEGSFKNVYVMTAYALSPYILIMPLVIAASYVLTLNEEFLITLPTVVAVAWSGIYLFMGVLYTHNYSFKETVKVLLLTVFFMLMAVVAAAILYLIWGQVASFLETLWTESLYRIQSIS